MLHRHRPHPNTIFGRLRNRLVLHGQLLLGAWARQETVLVEQSCYRQLDLQLGESHSDACKEMKQINLSHVQEKSSFAAYNSLDLCLLRKKKLIRKFPSKVKRKRTKRLIGDGVDDRAVAESLRIELHVLRPEVLSVVQLIDGNAHRGVGGNDDVLVVVVLLGGARHKGGHRRVVAQRLADHLVHVRQAVHRVVVKDALLFEHLHYLLADLLLDLLVGH